MCSKDSIPESSIFTLISFVGARDYPDRQRQVCKPRRSDDDDDGGSADVKGNIGIVEIGSKPEAAVDDARIKWEEQMRLRLWWWQHPQI
jgi:hypothetical protein